ncbi:MAG: MaoC family dehydratase N-terminal domain-containing protein [Deltaproteobacteria bacterium]|nr:MaoC family dehydratase N-terminal domain-containing protein [Deltaproteobacteria bacterium]MBW2417917.1 MaoC family dehydratase N-terminal domain-containing protein [Deltaproteobacteria bacterium]
MASINPPGIPVERGKIHEFAEAILDEHPHYHDEEAARSAGLPGVVAPPTFPIASLLYAGAQQKIPPELAALDMRFALHGAQEFSFERPLFAGDQLTSEMGEVKAYEKEGKRGGLMKFVELETLYRDAAGEIVARSRTTAIQTAGVVKES